jgi:uncharacterized protein YegP (UPF0339 family)
VTYYIYVDIQGLWHWYLTTDNNKLFALSPLSYPNEVECRDAIELVKTSANAPVVVFTP